MLKPNREELDRLQFCAGQQHMYQDQMQNCPRCGGPGIMPGLHANEVSRLFNIRICDNCNRMEAITLIHKQILPFKSWACMRPGFQVCAGPGEKPDEPASAIMETGRQDRPAGKPYEKHAAGTHSAEPRAGHIQYDPAGTEAGRAWMADECPDWDRPPEK